MDAQPKLLDQMIAAGLLVPTGVDGLYGRSGVFEDVIARFEALVTGIGEPDGAEVLRFPPGISMQLLKTSGYMKSFPQLAGTVHSFCGDDGQHAALIEKLDAGEDWTGDQCCTDIALTPAACYPLYPMLAAQGTLPAEGRLFDVQSYCFRHEPSTDPCRMQLFRMREYVRAGTAEQVQAFRAGWIERAKELIGKLELPFDVVPANDPFFGRAGKMMKLSQREQGLKLEMVIPVANAQPTACLSFNYHQDHFASTWGVRLADGTLAHTGCVGFGLERLALALFKRHGPEVQGWPSRVRGLLWG
ncbi:amino acid--[acyl-carrier-protein] ligase [Phenylobacterium sp.]|uniref:amino acid--[acyl-carrier-protein] ligase n=1 Tax=Phenylobacterium sp. TaxID=1871053 RepID=UPI002DF08A24|nr:amino acid--[acyl-carrier-protein] ligase [Phenylobacterium sp.]